MRACRGSSACVGLCGSALPGTVVAVKCVEGPGFDVLGESGRAGVRQ